MKKDVNLAIDSAQALSVPLLLTSVVGQVFAAASTAGRGRRGFFGGGAVRGRPRGRASWRQTTGRSCMKPILAKSRDTLDRFTDFDPATLYEAAGRAGIVDPAIRPAWHRRKGLRPRDHRRMSAVRQPDAAHRRRQRSGRLRHRRNGGLRTCWRAPGERFSRKPRVRAALPAWSSTAPFATSTPSRPCSSRSSAAAWRSGRARRSGGQTQHGRFRSAVPPWLRGDLIFGNADGLVVIEGDRIEEVYEAAVERRKKEAEIIAKLRQGRTTMELFGLTRSE